MGIRSGLLRMLTREMKQVSAKRYLPIEGVYIVRFVDNKWRVAACHNISDIECHENLSAWDKDRNLTQYEFINHYFTDAKEFDHLFDAVKEAEILLKATPNAKDGIAVYPGIYKVPFRKEISARHNNHFPRVG